MIFNELIYFYEERRQAMKNYQSVLKKHLAEYKQRRLGVREPGIYRKTGKAYQHILPEQLKRLNLMESIRGEFRDYLRETPDVRLHSDFHHLNSSQAFAFNLFFPFLVAGGNDSRALMRQLGLDQRVVRWNFEHVPDKTEGTNVDVSWQDTDGVWTFCEVKLSEAEFGSGKDDDRHQKKLSGTYKTRLVDLVAPTFLDRDKFFKYYQLLRNISLLHTHTNSRVIFLTPKENSCLHPSLEQVLAALKPSARHRVHAVYVEDVLFGLAADEKLSERLRLHVTQIREKYVIS